MEYLLYLRNIQSLWMFDEKSLRNTFSDSCVDFLRKIRQDSIWGNKFYQKYSWHTFWSRKESWREISWKLTRRSWENWTRQKSTVNVVRNHEIDGKKLDLVMKVNVPCKVHKFKKKIHNESFSWKTQHSCFAESYRSRRIFLERILRKNHKDHILHKATTWLDAKVRLVKDWERLDKLTANEDQKISHQRGRGWERAIPRMWNQSRRKKTKTSCYPDLT